jgi:hypothetical protein
MPPRTTSRSDAPPAKSDAYTGLLLISLLAMLTGIVLLYLDWSQYPDQKPQLPSRPPPAAAGGGGGGGGAPVVPPGGPPAGGPPAGPPGAPGNNPPMPPMPPPMPGMP